mmetsp:Transcript_75916/g.136982  ORF Transcript_75916/g.136982 Transcript_75916/m.136982 type:complete len:209 (-) Transcript_75916:602-1228(-)
MSSTTSEHSCQRSWALETSFSTALWASSGLNLPTMWTACAGGITSHTPSEHTRMRFSWSTSNSTSAANSGSHERPWTWAWKSPKHRDMANVHPSAASRPELPFSSMMTVPPAFCILIISSFLSGRWMSVSCVTVQLSSLDLREATTAIESPRCAHRTRSLFPAASGRSSSSSVIVQPEFSDFLHISGSSLASLQSLVTAAVTAGCQLS